MARDGRASSPASWPASGRGWALAGAAGAPGAQAAISDSCAAWGTAIEALERQAATLDRNLQGAADAYAETDAAAMPGFGA